MRESETALDLADRYATCGASSIAHGNATIYWPMGSVRRRYHEKLADSLRKEKNEIAQRLKTIRADSPERIARLEKFHAKSEGHRKELVYEKMGPP